MSHEDGEDGSEEGGHGDHAAGDQDHGHGDEGDQEHGHAGHHDDDHGHGHHHHDVESVGAAVVTVSSTRSLDDDPAGDAIADAFESAGHSVATRELLRDDYDSLQTAVENLANRDDVDVVVTSGGTGITPDDVTVEAAEDLFSKELPGFGELFRRLSYDEVGTRIVGTRATAGIVDEAPVFCLPGSENAARLGAEEVIVPEAPHLAGLAGRDDDADESGIQNDHGGDHEGDEDGDGGEDGGR